MMRMNFNPPIWEQYSVVALTRSCIELSLPPTKWNKAKETIPYSNFPHNHWIVENIKHKTRVLHLSLLHELLNKQMIECFNLTEAQCWKLQGSLMNSKRGIESCQTFGQRRQVVS